MSPMPNPTHPIIRHLRLPGARLRPWLGPDASHLIAGRVRAPLVVFIYLSVLALAVLDKYVQDFRADWVRAMILALVLLDLPALGAWLGRPLRARLMFTAAGGAATMLLAELARLLTARPEVTMTQAWGAVLEADSFLIWLATLWLAAPLLSAGHSRPEDPPRALPREFRLHVGMLLLLGLWSFMTALASTRPDRSLGYFSLEIGITIPFLLFWLRHAAAAPELQRRLKWAAAGVLFLALAAATTVAVTYMVAGDELTARIEAFTHNYSHLVAVEWLPGGQKNWRLEFPFGHHNRLAYFSMLALLVFCFAALDGPTSRRGLAAVGGAMALAVMLMTLNRGVLIALAPATGFTLFALYGRRAAWLLLLLPVAAMLLPSAQRERVLTIFEPATYTRQGSTVAMRLTHMQVAGAMIADNPVFGIGYSWRHFERSYSEFFEKQNGSQAGEVTHAHNIWLQTGAETGLPGLLIYLAWNLSRWGLLAGLWRRRRELDGPDRRRLILWCAVEIAIQVYCLSNHPLRRSLGLISWGFWAVMLADLALMSLRYRQVTAVQKPAPRADASYR